MAMTLRLEAAHETALAAIVARTGASKHEAILRGILHEADRLEHQAAVTASSQRVRARYAEVIERLGQ